MCTSAHRKNVCTHIPTNPSHPTTPKRAAPSCSSSPHKPAFSPAMCTHCTQIVARVKKRPNNKNCDTATTTSNKTTTKNYQKSMPTTRSPIASRQQTGIVPTPSQHTSMLHVQAIYCSRSSSRQQHMLYTATRHTNSTYRARVRPFMCKYTALSRTYTHIMPLGVLYTMSVHRAARVCIMCVCVCGHENGLTKSRLNFAHQRSLHLFIPCAVRACARMFVLVRIMCGHKHAHESTHCSSSSRLHSHNIHANTRGRHLAQNAQRRRRRRRLS